MGGSWIEAVVILLSTDIAHVNIHTELREISQDPRSEDMQRCMTDCPIIKEVRGKLEGRKVGNYFSYHHSYIGHNIITYVWHNLYTLHIVHTV